LEEPVTLEEDAAVAAAPRRFRLRTFSSLRHADYRYLWTGTLFMSAGQWIQQVTLGWLLYDLTGSSVLLGMLNGIRALPFLVASPIAGVAADRMDRRRLILTTQYILFITAVSMGLLVASGYLMVWHLFAFTVITGVTWAFVDPVRQSLVPALVPGKIWPTRWRSIRRVQPDQGDRSILGGALIVFPARRQFFRAERGLCGRADLGLLMTIPPTPPEARRPRPRQSQGGSSMSGPIRRFSR
jgi:hypothetical protein